MVSSLFEGTPVQIRFINSHAGNVNKHLQKKTKVQHGKSDKQGDVFV